MATIGKDIIEAYNDQPSKIEGFITLEELIDTEFDKIDNECRQEEMRRWVTRLASAFSVINPDAPRLWKDEPVENIMEHIQEAFSDLMQAKAALRQIKEIAGVPLI